MAMFNGYVDITRGYVAVNGVVTWCRVHLGDATQRGPVVLALLKDWLGQRSWAQTPGCMVDSCGSYNMIYIYIYVYIL